VHAASVLRCFSSITEIPSGITETVVRSRARAWHHHRPLRLSIYPLKRAQYQPTYSEFLDYLRAWRLPSTTISISISIGVEIRPLQISRTRLAAENSLRDHPCAVIDHIRASGLQSALRRFAIESNGEFTVASSSDHPLR